VTVSIDNHSVATSEKSGAAEDGKKDKSFHGNLLRDSDLSEEVAGRLSLKVANVQSVG
jgi:hypothetical protein